MTPSAQLRSRPSGLPATGSTDGNNHAARTGLVYGAQSPMREVERACQKIAASDATVLLTGETGTGKEVISRFIHAYSGRAGKPFVPVNCGAIPESLIESELFGYMRGAFTGANTSRQGRIGYAEGGTLFLDEIGELPLAMQVKLLRVLQEHVYEPIGSAKSVPANFRLIAATNRDLAAEVEAGRFRRDLYYRLLVCPVELPPLRRRTGDIAELVHHFWRLRNETRPIAPEVLTVLERYEWPGNVRELENLTERLSVCAEGTTITLQDLPPGMRNGGGVPQGDSHPFSSFRFAPRPEPALHAQPSPVVPFSPMAEKPLDDLGLPTNALALPSEIVSRSASTPMGHDDLDSAARNNLTETLAQVLGSALQLPIDLPQMLRQIEDAYIASALDRSAGNKKAAAELIGMQRTTLVEKLRRRNRDTSVG